MSILIGVSFALLWWKGVFEGARLDPHWHICRSCAAAVLVRRPGAIKALVFTVAASAATSGLAALLSS